MATVEASDEAKQALLDRGVPLFSAAIVGRTDDGDYVVCNVVPGLSVSGTGFVITRQWIKVGEFFGEQWYELHDERGDDDATV